MTAIAGLVGVPPTGTRESACSRSLDAQSLYGSQRSVRLHSDAAFGANRYHLLPEDRFDRQPYSDDRFLLVADIRLDNRADLLAALGESTANATGCSDAEILFRAWCRWQDGCLDRIAGDYAFAVQDLDSNALWLVRDPVGQRPLFYGRRGGALFFASMPSGILVHGRSEHDQVRIVERLAARDGESRRSYFQGVSRVLSGETVVIAGDKLTTKPWEPSVDAVDGGSREDLVCELSDKLDAAVSARLRRTADPVATHLSAGYDSSAVTSAAVMLSKSGEVVAFTSAPGAGLCTVEVRGRITDESAIAAETARSLGIDHEIVRTARPLLDCLRGHARYYQEPVRNVLNMDWWTEIQRRAAVRGGNVLLTGELGNLTFSAGGLSVLADWVRKREWRRWWKEATAAARRPDVRWRGILWNSFRQSIPERLNEELIRFFLGQPRWTSACFARPELLRQLPDEKRSEPRTPAGERLHILRGFDAGPFRKGSLAKNGIDERDPTADRRLIEFALRLPPEHLLDGGTYKPLARAVLRNRVPAAVLDSSLRGYQGADWISRLRRDDVLAVTEEISSSTTVNDVIDLQRLKEVVSRWPDARTGNEWVVESFGRHVTAALAMGMFIVESENGATVGA
jgi:asparagine synthase (glutamine-hydrolysing)